MEKFAKLGIKYIAMRCAGFDRVDLKAVEKAGMRICRVPTYSPTSVAEMAIALMMALNRCIEGVVLPRSWGLDNAPI